MVVYVCVSSVLFAGDGCCCGGVGGKGDQDGNYFHGVDSCAVVRC